MKRIISLLLTVLLLSAVLTAGAEEAGYVKEENTARDAVSYPAFEHRRFAKRLTNMMRCIIPAELGKHHNIRLCYGFGKLCFISHMNSINVFPVAWSDTHILPHFLWTSCSTLVPVIIRSSLLL